MSNSLQPHRLYSPWNSPGQNTGVGSLSLLQGIFPTQGSNRSLLHCRRILYQLSHQGSPTSLRTVAKNMGLGLGPSDFNVQPPRLLTQAQCLWLWTIAKNNSAKKNSVRTHKLQHTRLPCSSLFPRVFANSTAAAKSFQSCPTLCDPIDGSPPGSPIPGVLQARTLEWVVISFFNAWKWKVKVKSLSRVRLLANPWAAAHQAPPSMGFSRQEDWSGVPLPSLSQTVGDKWWMTHFILGH